MKMEEKLLVTSNFPFSYKVFKRLVLQAHENQGLFGKGLRDLGLSFTTPENLKLVHFESFFRLQNYDDSRKENFTF